MKRQSFEQPCKIALECRFHQVTTLEINCFRGSRPHKVSPQDIINFEAIRGPRSKKTHLSLNLSGVDTFKLGIELIKLGASSVSAHEILAALEELNTQLLNH